LTCRVMVVLRMLGSSDNDVVSNNYRSRSSQLSTLNALIVIASFFC